LNGVARHLFQAPNPEPRIMRYELTDYEWAAIKPFLPNKPRGVPRVDDRRVLNGIFWVLRSGAPGRDLPDKFGPYHHHLLQSLRSLAMGGRLGRDYERAGRHA
jgi:transposase